VDWDSVAAVAGSSSHASLRTIALFEAAKGAVVLIAGAGLLRWMHHHAQHAVDDLVRHLHLNPARSHPRIFEQVIERVSKDQLEWLAAGALLYAVFRFVEAGGLWRQRRWAEWLALVSGGIYLPFELYEVFHTRHWAAVAVFAVNLLIVAVLAGRLRRGHDREKFEEIGGN
jgi:uncharacterized membrane protein (DUF2068 family)